LKAHLGRITEDTPEHQGVVVFNMADVPLVSRISVSSSGARRVREEFGARRERGDCGVDREGYR
jgi:ribosome biogenesis protein Nip4